MHCCDSPYVCDLPPSEGGGEVCRNCGTFNPYNLPSAGLIWLATGKKPSELILEDENETDEK